MDLPPDDALESPFGSRLEALACFILALVDMVVAVDVVVPDVNVVVAVIVAAVLARVVA